MPLTSYNNVSIPSFMQESMSVGSSLAFCITVYLRFG